MAERRASPRRRLAGVPGGATRREDLAWQRDLPPQLKFVAVALARLQDQAGPDGPLRTSELLRLTGMDTAQLHWCLHELAATGHLTVDAPARPAPEPELEPAPPSPAPARPGRGTRPGRPALRLISGAGDGSRGRRP